MNEHYELEAEELMEEHYSFDVNHPGDGSSISTVAYQTISQIPQMRNHEEDKEEGDGMQNEDDYQEGIGLKNLRDRKNINYNEDKP